MCSAVRRAVFRQALKAKMNSERLGNRLDDIVRGPEGPKGAEGHSPGSRFQKSLETENDIDVSAPREAQNTSRIPKGASQKQYKQIY